MNNIAKKEKVFLNELSLSLLDLPHERLGTNDM